MKKSKLQEIELPKFGARISEKSIVADVWYEVGVSMPPLNQKVPNGTESIAVEVFDSADAPGQRIWMAVYLENRGGWRASPIPSVFLSSTVTHWRLPQPPQGKVR